MGGAARQRRAAAALRRAQADRRYGGETLLGPLHSPFAVVGRELRYEGRLSRGLVDSVEPGEDGWWDGVARYRGSRSAASPSIGR